MAYLLISIQTLKVIVVIDEFSKSKIETEVQRWIHEIRKLNDTSITSVTSLNCNSWDLISQIVSDLTEVDRPLSPVAAIRVARYVSAK